MDWRSRANAASGGSSQTDGRASQTLPGRARESYSHTVTLDEPVALQARQDALEPRGSDLSGQPVAGGQRGDDPAAGPAIGVLEARGRAGRGARRTGSTRPRDWHHGAAGHSPQRGVLALQTRAPSSIAAWFQSACRVAGRSPG